MELWKSQRLMKDSWPKPHEESRFILLFTLYRTCVIWVGVFMLSNQILLEIVEQRVIILFRLALKKRLVNSN